MRNLVFSVTKKDLEITWFSGTGAGGQHRNKHQNCCRIRHPESGVIATGQSQRERGANMREALNGLAQHPKFVAWAEGWVVELETGETVEQKVERLMSIENLLTETRGVDGRWQSEEWKQIVDDGHLTKTARQTWSNNE